MKENALVSCSETYKYYKEDKICLKEVDECEDFLLIKLDTNKCVESCLETQFKYDNKCRDNIIVLVEKNVIFRLIMMYGSLSGRNKMSPFRRRI